MKTGRTAEASCSHQQADEVEPIVGLSACKLINQGAEAVSILAAWRQAPRFVLLLCCSPPMHPYYPELNFTILQRVWESTFCGHPCIIKQRFSKKYRHPALDRKLTVTRLKQVRTLPPRGLRLVPLRLP